MSSDALAHALTALAQFQVTDATVGDTLHRIAEISAHALPAASFVGMTMLDEKEQPTTAVFTDPDSPEIDAAQYRDSAGPCLDAWRTRSMVRLDVVAEAVERYPRFAAACEERGVQSTLSFPMMAGEVSVGALNLYANAPSSFTKDDEAIGATLARVAGTVLANVAASWTPFDLTPNRNEAMKTRATIEQAKGMLMAREPYPTADEAFDLLRAASQRENVKLRDVAQRIVDRKPPPAD